MSKVKSSGTTLSEPVLALRLLKSANLTQSQEQLVRATITKIDYKSMVLQLKKVVGNQVHSDLVRIKEESEEILPSDTYYGGKYKNSKFRCLSSQEKQQRYYEDDIAFREDGYRKDSYNQNKPRKIRGRNPIDPYGKITRCRICDSVNHWENKCPDKDGQERDTYYEECLNGPHQTDHSEESITYEVETHNVCLNSEFQNDLAKIVCCCESYNVAILDSGAPKSVCGISWLNQYIGTLSPEDKSKVKYRPARTVYKFGCVSTTEAIHKVTFPVAIGDIDVLLKADVVKGELPLLLSRSFMKQANSELNFKEDKIKLLDQTLTLLTTRSGHYALPLGRNKCNSNASHANKSAKLRSESDEKTRNVFNPNNCASETVYFTKNTMSNKIPKDVIEDDTIKIISRSLSINAENDMDVRINTEKNPYLDKKIGEKSGDKNLVKTNLVENKKASDSEKNDLSDSEVTMSSKVGSNSKVTSENSNILSFKCLPDTSKTFNSESETRIIDKFGKLAPIFVSDGIVGDLSCLEISSKVFPGKSKAITKEIEVLKRDIWLSVGNFLPISLPESLGDGVDRNNFTCNMIESMRKNLNELNNKVKHDGGRLFVIEVFPPPCILDPDRSKFSASHQKLGWELFLGLNKLIKDFNSKNGIMDTLNVSSYLRSSIKLNKEGKRKYLKKSCIKITSDNDKCVKWESKIKKKLHHNDNVHLLEPTRLIVSHVIQKAIRNKSVNC